MNQNYNFLASWFYKTRERIQNGLINQENFSQNVEEILNVLLLCDLRELVDDQNFSKINKNISKQLVNIGGVLIGGSEKCVVQSMAISSLQKIDALHKEFIELVDAGSEIVRIACVSENDALKMSLLKERLHGTKYDKIPIVMCGQYNIAPIIKNTDILNHISKVRINPGNITLHSKNDDNFVEAIKHLVNFNSKLINRPKICIRIGVNWGSLDEKLKTIAMDLNNKLMNPNPSNHIERIALVLSAISSGLYAEMLGLQSNLIAISCKTSTVSDSYITYKLLDILCDYPIHLGITEAGQGDDGVILTACGIAPLLLQGIGSTLRVSITPKMNESRTKEVYVCKQILQSVGIRQFKPKTTSCPGCGRTDSNFFRELTEKVDVFIQENLEVWCEKYNNQDIRGLKVAVMGCLVNGPGESKHSDIGISLPGYRESHSAVIYIDGRKYCVLKSEDEIDITKEFFGIIEKYIEKKFLIKDCEF
jgi:(E)-4-hydroxy-3-methylbut-2-enyl-diphosphate synthase